MKRTKIHHFLMPDSWENYNINIQNDNWNRLDKILALIMVGMSIQTIALIILLSDFCG